jgi:3-hydroxyisobutyrate dehydrogenase-like beta-hydroxyacid dehydrogenase
MSTIAVIAAGKKAVANLLDANAVVKARWALQLAEYSPESEFSACFCPHFILSSRSGCKVLTNLDNRSEATRQRARDAGMQDASFKEIGATCDWVLSILPPSDAFALAERFLQESAASTRLAGTPSACFVDCNAVNPKTVHRIAALFKDSPSKFIDAGIIGGPPEGDYNPTFYASSSEDSLLDNFVALSKSGLKISALKGEGAGIGDASALKMSYAVSSVVPWGAKC